MSPIAILFLVTFISMLGFGLLIPLTPAFALMFHLSKMQIGILAATFPLMQVISSIILGILSDSIGRKKTIYISFFIVSLAYLILTFADSFGLLLLSRALSGFFSGAIVASMAGASDLSTKETRMKYMGLIGMAFGLGFMLGPSIGGILAGNDIEHVNVTLLSVCSSVISLVAALLTLFFLPETKPEKKEGESSGKILATIIESFRNKITFLHFILNTLVSAIFASLEIFVTMTSANVLAFTPLQTGLFWASFSVILNFGRVFLLKYLGHYKGLIICFMVMGISILFYIPTLGIPLKYAFYVTSGFVAVMAGVAVTVITSKVSLQGSVHSQGLLFGFNNSLGNLGRFLGPFVLGSVWQWLQHIYYIWGLISIISFVGAMIAYYLLKNAPKTE